MPLPCYRTRPDESLFFSLHPAPGFLAVGHKPRDQGHLELVWFLPSRPILLNRAAFPEGMGRIGKS